MATVGSFGSRHRSEYSAMGMQVNLASRLETACKPGGILVSHPTWALVNDQIDFLSSETRELKGFSRPVRVYEVSLGDGNDQGPPVLAARRNVLNLPN